MAPIIRKRRETPIIRKRRETPMLGPMTGPFYAATDEQVFKLLAAHAVGTAHPIACGRCGMKHRAIRDARGGLTGRFHAVSGKNGYELTLVEAPERIRPKHGRIAVKCRLCGFVSRLPVQSRDGDR